MAVATLCAHCRNLKPCPTHQRKLPSSTQRGYDYAWQQLRLTVLTAHPICQHGLCTERSSEADHIIPLSKGGKRLDRTNVQALCRSHNRRKWAN